MCSNSNNNRRHHISYYVVAINGRMVDRRRVTNPALRTAGMPRPLAHAAANRAWAMRPDSAGPEKRDDLPARSRSDHEGWCAAALLRPQDAPARIHSTEGLRNKVAQYGRDPAASALVMRNILDHSTFMAVVDLRDDPSREADGATIVRGAIWTPGITERGTKVSVQIYTEIAGNSSRAEEELEWIAQECYNLRELSIEVIGENNLDVAVSIRDRLAAGAWARFPGPQEVSVNLTASLYETEA